MNSLCGRLALLLVAALTVTGCASSAQLAQRDEERCAARGYQPKTDGFADCLLRLESERSERTETRRREMLEKPYIPPMPGGGG
jgi:hypothetical protein